MLIFYASAHGITIAIIYMTMVLLPYCATIVAQKINYLRFCKIWYSFEIFWIKLRAWLMFIEKRAKKKINSLIFCRFLFSSLVGLGPTKHRKEHKGADLFKNTRILTTRDHKEHKRTNFLINTKISTTREHK